MREEGGRGRVVSGRRKIPHPIVLLVTGEILLRARDGKAQDASQEPAKFSKPMNN